MAQSTSQQAGQTVPADNVEEFDTAPVSLKRILVALDASEYADHALDEATKLAKSAEGVVTGIHAYAAKLHDNRFRQMEGGLPERYRQEDEMERQRGVHDDLITRGLGIVSDSYHDSAVKVCDAAGIPYRRLNPEGKNYRRIVEAAQSGDFDLLAMGSMGLGAVSGSVLGTVCQRVARRSPIDVLVVREPGRRIGDGPLVVALDGSHRSFGALLTALDLARRVGGDVHAVAAYDPYFHYVAFDKIAGALSEEASKEFRFKEQEDLHEEIIDAGIAKIYQSHLEIAEEVAKQEGTELVTKLLDGKPYQVIANYAKEVGASLLLMGKTGIHSDADLDIGGNSENLLRNAPCHVWLGQATFTPPTDVVARETIVWTEEAEDKMTRVPETARGMVRMAVLRFAQESGHTVITSALIEEATNRFCPERGGSAPTAPEPLTWSQDAVDLVKKTGDPSVAKSVRLSSEKRARREKSDTVTVEHVTPFIDHSDAATLEWSAAALARLARVPQMVRGSLRVRVEANAQEAGSTKVDADTVEAMIVEARQVMDEAMQMGGHPGADGPGGPGGGDE